MGTTPAAPSSFEENRQSRKLAALLSLEMFIKKRTCPGPLVLMHGRIWEISAGSEVQLYGTQDTFPFWAKGFQLLSTMEAGGRGQWIHGAPRQQECPLRLAEYLRTGKCWGITSEQH